MELFLLGIFLGIVAGLVPSMHPNTLIALLYPIMGNNPQFWQIIVGMLPAHLLFSLVPAVFFGVVQPNNALGALPGQRLAYKGEGISALNATLCATVLCVLLAVVLFVPSFAFFQIAYGTVKPYMGPILVLFSLILLGTSKNPMKSGLVFCAAGVLGVIALKSSMFDPFLPLFAGFFSLPAILRRRNNGMKLPEQRKETFPVREVLFGVFIGFFGGMASDVFAGISAPSQVAAFASIVMPFSGYTYLATTTSISASQLIFALSTEHSIDKARVGGIEWLSKSVSIDDNLTAIFMLIIISSGICAGLVYFLRKRFAYIAQYDMAYVHYGLGVLIVGLTLWLDGILGIMILGACTIVGYICQEQQVERTHLMAAIIVPTALLLFRIFL